MQLGDSRSILQAAERIEPRIGGRVGCALILGSGFSSLLDLLDDRHSVPFTEIEGLPGCGAPGHEGRFVAGFLAGQRILMISGRLHLYEGLSAAEVTTPVALAHALGADRILLTCAAGATRRTLTPGSIVVIEDHINLTGANPLLVVPITERRPVFLPLGDAYDPAALDLASRLGRDLERDCVKGVLASVTGPSYETPAEYRAFERLGADVVSMSCALETIAARSLGMRVLALAVVANGPARSGERGAHGGQVLELVQGVVRESHGFFRQLIADFAVI